jgi:hypothetical protein
MGSVETSSLSRIMTRPLPPFQTVTIACALMFALMSSQAGAAGPAPAVPHGAGRLDLDLKPEDMGHVLQKQQVDEASRQPEWMTSGKHGGNQAETAPKDDDSARELPYGAGYEARQRWGVGAAPGGFPAGSVGGGPGAGGGSGGRR